MKISCSSVMFEKQNYNYSNKNLIKTNNNINNYSNTGIMSYPSNYYLSFGKNFNVDLINQMRNTSSVEEINVLFKKMPQTIQHNCTQTVLRFKNEGLTTKNYLTACTKQPQLFYQPTDFIENNVRELVSKFKEEGLTTQDYLKACVKSPSLFCQPADTIENHIREVVSRFKKEGLTTKKYLNSCVKKPPLFTLSPDTVEFNIRELVSRFKNEGLTIRKYLGACLKQHSLFCQSPDTIAEHINTMKFCNINSKKPLNNNEFWKARLSRPIEFAFSTKNIMTKGLIIPKMFENAKIPKELQGTGVVEKLQKYLQNNPDKKFTLNVTGKEEDVQILRKCIDEITNGENNQFSVVVTK